MPVAPVPQQAQQPPAQPPQGGGAAPFGASQATGPTQNKGYEVAAQKLAGLALLVLEQALPLAGAGTDPGRVIHKCIGDLAKIVPPGSVTPADVNTMLQKMMMQQQQFQQMQQRMQQQQQGGGQPQPGAGAAQQQPMARAA